MARKREYKQEWGITFLKCKKCWKRLTLDCYNKDASKQLWIRSDCRECTKAWLRDHYSNNKDVYSAYKKKYQEKNKKKIAERKRLYRQNHKEQIAQHKREYYIANHEYVKEHTKQYKNRRTEELWFNWTSFHCKATEYVKQHDLKPKSCPICWCVENIQIHHPSYKSYEDRSKVVFCCVWCHQRIHAGHIQSPEPINLLDFN